MIRRYADVFSAVGSIMQPSRGRRMFRRIILILLFTCGIQIFAEESTTVPEKAKETVGSVVRPAEAAESSSLDSARKKWLDSKLPVGINPDDLSPDEIARYFEQETSSIDRWFSVRGDLLLHAMILSAIVVFCVLAAWFIFKKIVNARLKRLKSPGTFWELVLALNGPFVFAVMMTGIFLSFLPVMNTFSAESFLYDVRFFFTVLALTAAWAAMNLVGIVNEKLQALAKRDDNSLDDLMVKLLRNILRILVFATTVFFIGQSIFRINITALLAGAGVLGLGAALAAKDTLSNFFGTIVILFDRPFKLGDRIQVGEVEGIVTEVGMRSSKILADDESFYTLPNSLLTTQAVRNINLKNHLKFLFTVTMTYDTTEAQMRKAIQVLHEITDNFKGPDRPCFSPRIFFSGFASSSMNITVIMWLKTESYLQEEQWKSELNLAILKRFAEENLSMAYPTTTSYLLTQKNAPLEIRMTETDTKE